MISNLLPLITLKKSLLLCLKNSAYLYVISGFCLAFFTLHWQSGLPLEMEQKVQSKKIEINELQNSMTMTNQEKLVSLSVNFNLSTYTIEGEKWLAFTENGRVDSIFSSKETATVLTVSRVYNIAVAVLVTSLLCLLISIKRNTLTVKLVIAISLVLFSQQFFSWSFMFNDGIVSKSGLAISNYMWVYITLALLALLFLRSIVTDISAVFNIQKNGLLSNENNKTESLIAYASQSGTAALIAKKMAQLLPQTSRYHVACVSSLSAHQLSEYQQVFLLASTYGDGEPPEQAMSFVSSLQKLEQPLNSVKYAVLALGDRKYPKFCAFGHQLAETLKEKGAQALLPVAEINQGNESSIQLWWQQLTQLLGWHSSTIEKSWQTQFTLSNDCINVKSPERPAHHIRLSAIGNDFTPGDLVEVMPEVDENSLVEKINQQGWSPKTVVNFQQKSILLLDALKQLFWQNELANNPQELIDKLPALTARTYSIASCQEQESIDLLVRKVIKNDNSVGLCSSYLAQLKEQQPVKIAVKSHQKFHPPSVETPIIMIAAGTGIAPFIGFLEQRQRNENKGKSWLIMGERNENIDDYFADKLNAFEQSGCLNKRQHAWSQGDLSLDAKYVGDIISQEQNEIRHWLLDLNAQLYVCGNAATLGTSCDVVLTDILGKEILANLIKNKQIKYDLY